MDKKAQIGQVFKYIMALIVAGMILFYGAKMVLDLVSVGHTVEVGNLLKNIEKETNIYYNYDEGSEDLVKINLGNGDAKYLCVFDKDQVINSNNCYYKAKGNIKRCSLKMFGESFEVMFDDSKAEKNIAIAPLGSSSVDTYDVEHLLPEDGKAMICYANGEDMILTTKRNSVECS